MRSWKKISATTTTTTTRTAAEAVESAAVAAAARAAAAGVAPALQYASGLRGGASLVDCGLWQLTGVLGNPSAIMRYIERTGFRRLRHGVVEDATEEKTCCMPVLHMPGNGSSIAIWVVVALQCEGNVDGIFFFGRQDEAVH